MLINDVVDFCDEQYSSFGNMCGQEDGICTHPSGQCSGSCYNCLYEIHYPGRAADDSKKLYDCPKMLFHYVCQYSYLYATELLCAFEYVWDFIKNFPYYHILSLGCGGCADLMAFDFLRYFRSITAPVAYCGVDVNDLWATIHHEIENYCDGENIRFNTRYLDVFDYFKRSIIDTNIIVISYLLSYLYNTDQINMVDFLADNLANNVIKNKAEDMPLLLIINDVNSYKRGRDCFSHFENAIRKNGLTIIKSEYKYFDTGALFNGQKVGTPYSTRRVRFNVPRTIEQKYNASTTINSTVQLLVEVV